MQYKILKQRHVNDFIFILFKFVDWGYFLFLLSIFDFELVNTIESIKHFNSMPEAWN